MKLVLMVAAFAGAAVATDATQCYGLLQRALEAKNPDTRKSAVVASSLVANDSPLILRLADMLDDKDVQVRVALVATLSEVKTPIATSALRRALRDKVPEVSFAAAKALYAAGDPDGKAALLSVLEGDTKTSSSFFTSEKRDALRMMHTPGATFLYALKEGLGFVPLPGFGEGVASMQALLSDPGTTGRATAALMLGKDKDGVTVNALKDALHDKDWHVRASAVHSLALQNDPALKNDLERLTLDDKEEVRLRAAIAWLRLNDIESRRNKRRRPARRQAVVPAPSRQ